MILFIPFHIAFLIYAIWVTNKIKSRFSKLAIRWIVFLAGPVAIYFNAITELKFSVAGSIFFSIFMYLLMLVFTLIGYAIISTIWEKVNDSPKPTIISTTVNKQSPDRRLTFTEIMVLIVVVVLYFYINYWGITHEKHWR